MQQISSGRPGRRRPDIVLFVNGLPLVEGRGYERIVPPQTGASPGRIGVLEFFS